MKNNDTNNMLSVLESYILPDADEIGLEIAADFRRRRIEKNLTRELLAEKAGILPFFEKNFSLIYALMPSLQASTVRLSKQYV